MGEKIGEWARFEKRSPLDRKKIGKSPLAAVKE